MFIIGAKKKIMQAWARVKPGKGMYDIIIGQMVMKLKQVSVKLVGLNFCIQKQSSVIKANYE